MKLKENNSFTYLTYPISFLILFCMLFPLTSCKEDDPGKVEEEETILTVSATSLHFTEEGGTLPIQVTSNAVWKFDFEAGLWSRPSIHTTKGNATVNIVADENETTEERTMTLTLTSKGAEDITITITQDASDPDPEEPVIADSIDPDNTSMRDLTSVQFTELMGIGWNLGNSMEAINVSGSTYTGNETSWGNPIVNKTLIDAVKAAGFNTLRIPASWSHMVDDEATFHIRYTWKLRVEEVINYALDNDMYVILNIHWDGGWMNHPTFDDQTEINTKLAAFWKQIAKHFRDYDDHLLFAGTNEVHVENDFGTPSAENAEVQNSFNQTFVNTVRATGGRNTYRHLIIQAYNTNIEHGVNYLTIPDDNTDDRLMVEVHFYDPYQFTLQGDGVALWGKEHEGSPAHSGWGDEDWTDQAFDMVKTNFVEAGYGVILGEYGALLRNNPQNTTYEEHVEARNYYLNYVTSAALEHGMVPVYWDNGYTGDNSFGLFNRSTGAQAHPDAIQAIVSADE